MYNFIKNLKDYQNTRHDYTFSVDTKTDGYNSNAKI